MPATTTPRLRATEVFLLYHNGNLTDAKRLAKRLPGESLALACLDYYPDNPALAFATALYLHGRLSYAILCGVKSDSL